MTYRIPQHLPHLDHRDQEQEDHQFFPSLPNLLNLFQHNLSNKINLNRTATVTFHQDLKDPTMAR